MPGPSIQIGYEPRFLADEARLAGLLIDGRKADVKKNQLDAPSETG